MADFPIAVAADLATPTECNSLNSAQALVQSLRSAESTLGGQPRTAAAAAVVLSKLGRRTPRLQKNPVSLVKLCAEAVNPVDGETGFSAATFWKQSLKTESEDS